MQKLLMQLFICVKSSAPSLYELVWANKNGYALVEIGEWQRYNEFLTTSDKKNKTFKIFIIIWLNNMKNLILWKVRCSKYEKIWLLCVCDNLT